MIGARDGAFQQAPDVLNAVRMDVATDIFFGAVIDDFMLRVMVPYSTIGSPIVRDDDFGIRCCMVFDKR